MESIVVPKVGQRRVLDHAGPFNFGEYEYLQVSVIPEEYQQYFGIDPFEFGCCGRTPANYGYYRILGLYNPSHEKIGVMYEALLLQPGSYYSIIASEVHYFPTATPEPTPSPSPSVSPSVVPTIGPTPIPTPTPTSTPSPEPTLPTDLPQGPDQALEVIRARLAKPGIPAPQREALEKLEERARELLEKISNSPSPSPTPTPQPTPTPFPVAQALPPFRVVPNQSDPDYKLVIMYNELVLKAQNALLYGGSSRYTVIPPRVGRKASWKNYVTEAEADTLGSWWLGRSPSGYSTTSSDGWRVYRRAAAKVSSGRTQANFEVLKYQYIDTAWVTDGHVNVEPKP